MICHFYQIINRLSDDFWKISLDEMYERLLRAVRARKSRFYIPSSERYCEADGYVLWGTYGRARIIDMQCIPCEDGGWRYEKVIHEDFHIQRIKEKETGSTHAVLNELFIPYKQYSLRYILFHLCQFFKRHVTQESYCLDAGIEPKTFGLWLKWLRDHITLLYGSGLTKKYSDNWQAMSQWIQKIAGDISGWTYTSLYKLNLTLFQKRKMPENTKYRNYERPG